VRMIEILWSTDIEEGMNEWMKFYDD
jgi:hypothetical protein